MEKLEKTHDINVHWHSFELRPKGSPPMPPAYRARIEAGQGQLKERARVQYGLDLNPGPLGIESRSALILAKYADAEGRGPAFHQAVMQAYWEQGRSIDDHQLLKEIANGVGLNTDNFESILVNPEYEAQVEADISTAHEYGLNGVPALIFADKYLVSGAQPLEMLRNVVEKVSEEMEKDE